jgi:hypothetical protein
MPSAGYGEIEIGLHRSQPETYEVELRVTDPGTDAEVAPARRGTSFGVDANADSRGWLRCFLLAMLSCHQHGKVFRGS